MKHGGKVAFCIATSMGLQLSAFALTADPNNPYTPIVDRNVFSLKAAPPPPDPALQKPVDPPSKVTLLGIVSYLGKKEVIFKTMASSKPGEAPKETTFSLGVKELQGDFEIVDIDHIAGTVRLKNHNVEQFLSLEKDGMKPAGGTGAPGGIPGAPGVPGASPVPTVPTAPGGTPSPFGAANVQRPIRATGTPTTAAGSSGTATPQAAQPQQMSVEEQAAVMEVQRVLTKEKVDRGEMPPLPPPGPGFNRPPSPGGNQSVPRPPGQ